ncbi:hypothetical protein GW17_00010482 [Ensete ventricosum]|nr:hypothetical protein GW17_00010482 [Ensete ventricosum]RZR92276.1 hypothetical protein BHM03_00020547 [Ensete ventricosum]
MYSHTPYVIYRALSREVGETSESVSPDPRKLGLEKAEIGEEGGEEQLRSGETSEGMDRVEDDGFGYTGSRDTIRNEDI